MGWVEVSSAAPQTSKGRWVEVEKPRSLGDDIGRQAGLMARTAVKGVTGIPAMVGDAANAAVNYGIRGVNSVAGTQIPQLGMVSDSVDAGLSKMGLPQPANVMERLNEVAGSALFGAGGAQIGANALAKVPQMAGVLGELARGPIVQGIGAATGALATEGAQKMGVTNPYALGAAGVIGSILPGGGATAALGGVRAAAAPFRRIGQGEIVGNVLNRLSTTPAATAERLAGTREIIPGSAPTVSQASGDAGLAGAESALRGMDERNLIGNRLSQQNAARMGEMNAMAGDEAALTAAKKYRDAAYKDVAEPAFANQKPISIGREWINNPVRRKIQELRESPAGARKTVRDALDEAEAQLTQEGVDLSNAEVLYNIRKDLALARDGKLTGKGKSGAELANLKTAKSELNDVIKSLDEVIETGAPGFKEYLKLYSERSVPVDQLKALQKIRSRAILAAPDPVTGEAVLSQSKFTTLLRNNLDEGLNLRGKGPDGAKLSPGHLAALDRIAADLDRGAAPNAATVRAPGSDTFKNMTTGAVIGRILGDSAAELVGNTSAVKTLVRPLNFLYRVPEQQIQQLMIEAWLDPKLAAQLMRKASESEIQSVAAQLGKRLGQQAAANALYGSQ